MSRTEQKISSLPETLVAEDRAGHRSWLSLTPAEQKRKMWLRRIIGATILILAVWFIPWVFLLKTGSVTVSRPMKNKEIARVDVGPDEKDWTPYDRVSKNLLNAIIASEDGRFYTHHGLDLAEIKHSIDTNIKRRRYARGGSTITQQVVKMAFLSREKTLIRKSREAIGAVLLESVLSKDEIITWYVNLVEFGDSIYGARAAAQSYFGTKPDLLTIEQAVQLAMILPNPGKWSKGLRTRSLTDFGHRRFAAIVIRMEKQGHLTTTQRDHALQIGNFGSPIKGYEIAKAREEDMADDCLNTKDCPASLAPITDDADEEEGDGADTSGAVKDTTSDSIIRESKTVSDPSKSATSEAEAFPPITTPPQPESDVAPSTPEPARPEAAPESAPETSQ